VIASKATFALFGRARTALGNITYKDRMTPAMAKQARKALADLDTFLLTPEPEALPRPKTRGAFGPYFKRLREREAYEGIVALRARLAEVIAIRERGERRYACDTGQGNAIVPGTTKVTAFVSK
jgi:hypothetical protein